MQPLGRCQGAQIGSQSLLAIALHAFQDGARLRVPNVLPEAPMGGDSRLDAVVFSSYGASVWSLAAGKGQKMEVAGGIEPP